MNKTKKWLIAVSLTLAFVVSIVCMIVVFPSKQVREFKNEGVKMIAHRGLSGLYTENTVAAFEAAGKADYYGIETDVHVTKDGKYVLFHDENIEELAGVNMEIAESDYEDLRAVELPVKGGGEKENYIPEFYEYIEICKEYEKQAIVELKASFTKEQVAEIVGILDFYGMKNNSTFISFDEDNLLFLREVFPKAPAQYLFEHPKKEHFDFALENGFDASMQFWRVLPSYVKRFHEKGLKVGCWTVDKKWQGALMKAYGVDYITSNILV